MKDLKRPRYELDTCEAQVQCHHHNRPPATPGLWGCFVALGSQTLAPARHGNVFKNFNIPLMFFVFKFLKKTWNWKAWLQAGMSYIILTLMLHISKYMSLMFYLLFKVLSLFLARPYNCEKATTRSIRKTARKRLLASSCVCVSVCLCVRFSFSRFSMDGNLWNLVLKHFSRLCRGDWNFTKIWQE
jgi:hypothetical protein